MYKDTTQKILEYTFRFIYSQSNPRNGKLIRKLAKKRLQEKCLHKIPTMKI